MRALLVVLLAWSCAACAPRGREPEQPNIVFVLVDDLNTRLVPYLPRLARLLPEQGMSLSMTVPTPVCAPSRATILTGKYAHNTGVKNNGVWAGGIWAFRAKQNEARAFPMWLRAAGYRTGFFGKYLNGHDGKGVDVPPGWDRWVSYAKITMSRADVEVIEEGGGRRALGNRYDTDFFGSAAATWLETVPEPFFAMWSPMAPHGPFVAPERHRDQFDRLVLEQPPSFAADVKEVTDLTRTRLQMMLGVEDVLERLVRVLEKRGLLERTYIVFTSDNGLFMGEHGHAAGKGEPYEETTQVPLYVRGPGVPAATTSDALVLNTDLAPTFAAIAGAEVPPDVDGRSILPLLHGQALARPRQRVLLEWFEPHGAVLWQAVRTRDRKFVRYADGRCLSFDLKRDPYEMTSGSCADAFARASDAVLARLAACRGNDCAAIESQ